jgi:hypothetical protein
VISVHTHTRHIISLCDISEHFGINTVIQHIDIASVLEAYSS